MEHLPIKIPIEGNRLYIKKELVEEWAKDQEILFVPLIWSRNVPLKPEGYIGAWAIIDAELSEDWRERIEGMENEAQTSQVAVDRLTLKQRGIVRFSEKRPQEWRITVPDYLRNSGVFPTEDELTGMKELEGISIWAKPTLAYHLAQIVIP